MTVAGYSCLVKICCENIWKMPGAYLHRIAIFVKLQVP